MIWFRNILTTIWDGIKKAWSWSIEIPGEIKNVFSSNKNQRSTKAENREVKAQNQQRTIVIAPKITIVRPTVEAKPKQNSYIQSLVNELPFDIVFANSDYNLYKEIEHFIDVDTLELIKKYPGACTIFISQNNGSLGRDGVEQYSKRLSNYLLCIDKLIKENEKLIGILNDRKVLDLSYQRLHFRNDIIMHCGQEFYNSYGFIKLLEHLAWKNVVMLNRIRNHSELAKCILLVKQHYTKGKLCTEIFDILFSHDQEDILEKLEYDLDFTEDTLKKSVYVSDVKDFTYKISCLQNKEYVGVLKRVNNSCLSDYTRIVHHSDWQYNPEKQLIKSFFEHHHNNPHICKMAINMGVDLKVVISIEVNSHDESIVYDETCKKYKVRSKDNNLDSNGINLIIDKILDKHFARIEGIIKPEYFKARLEGHFSGKGKEALSNVIDSTFCSGAYNLSHNNALEALNNVIDSTFCSGAYNLSRNNAIEALIDPSHKVRSLQHICLEQLVKNSNQSRDS